MWLTPPPDQVDVQAWHMLAIFLGTILGLVLRPLPMGAVVLTGLTAGVFTSTLTIEQALAGFQNRTVWLIVSAFLFARCLTKTGLGRRLAFSFIRAFGHKTLGLAYALALTDLVLSPGIPSGTARTGGVMFPIVKSLASAYDSEPGPTAGRIGAYLMHSAYQMHSVTCAMFLTAMVANPLMLELAREVAGVQITWIGWASAALVPGVLSFLGLPLLILGMVRPEIRATPEAARLASDELERMGAMRRHEKVLVAVFGLVVFFWVTGQWTGLHATAVAFFGLCLMLFTGVIEWTDVVGERAAWDALVWFGGLVAMATMLGEMGLADWFSSFVGEYMTGWNWVPVMGVLALVYMYSHYFFASLTAHATALYAPFLATAVAAGAPPYFAALVFAFFTSLCASLTHYAGGPSPLYWGAGYIDLKQWWTVGFAASVMFVAIWLGVGWAWWSLLGLV